ncbi:hypothetical protein [Phytoactinopolyspora mesophila]|uniref:Uncharacterized protein n=1 Tax=Phytoactinopolyspora mesophila TaxID=2650750 RepID=A0A7K3LY66_9ACTN|nr:hypothetical protein [Phytoactinopolyspora mesophila]NDL55965.1 hypothetical protein [Phytoactinopolyspora mesophila]
MRPRITQRRRWIGAGIALLGAAAVAGSAYPAWYEGQGPRDWPLEQLFTASPAGTATAFWGSVAAPLAVVGLLGALGAVLRFRFILGLGWLVGSATFALWALMSIIGGNWSPDGLTAGAWLCLSGLAVLLGGILGMGPRKEGVEAPLSVFEGDPPQ